MKILRSTLRRLGFEDVVPISAAHGRGMTDLLELIDRKLPPFRRTGINKERATIGSGDCRQTERRKIIAH